MSKILIDPDDLTNAAGTCGDAATSLGDVRDRLVAVPPVMPSDVMARVYHVFEDSLRDLTEQRVYLEREAGSLLLCAGLAKVADKGGLFWQMLKHAGGGDFGLTVRFGMAPPHHKKSWTEKGVPGFFSGAYHKAGSTLSGAGSLLKMGWEQGRHPGAPNPFDDGLVNAFEHPGQAWHALWADASSQDDRDKGDGSKAAGGITVEIATLLIPFSKFAKLSKLAELERIESETDAAAAAAKVTVDSAKTAAERLAEGPRWRTGEVPWQPQGSAPGRWANPQDFTHKVVDPADAAAAAARQQALGAQQRFDDAEHTYDRFEKGVKVAETYEQIDLAAKLEDVTTKLDEQDH